VAYLEDGDFVAIDHAGAKMFDETGAPVERPMVIVPQSPALMEKGNYRHFMEKELHEHPAVLGDTLRQYLDPKTLEVRLPRLPEYARHMATPRQRSATPSHERRSVVVVDDNLDAAESMAMLLRNVGHEVRIEHDGLAAIKELTRELPDIVLLDIGLPGISGYEVAKRLRQHPGGESVRIYAMTGYGQEDDRRRSMEAGFDGHLVKPVIPSDLFALVDAAVRPH